MLGASESGEPRDCALESFTHTRVTARCFSAVPSVAVFVEQYDAGWSATVDGKPTPVVRANLLARAVPLPAGDHRIVLEYHAPGLSLAVFLSVLGVLGLGAALALRRRPLALVPTESPG